MASKQLKEIFIHSGLSDKLEGFCTISINGGDLLGQLSPDEVRGLALQWLAAAEAAEQDSIVASMLTKDIGLDLNTALGFIVKMRDRRS